VPLRLFCIDGGEDTLVRALFLPDNLFASIIEEQGLFQSLTDKVFRQILPLFKTNKDFASILIYPPIAVKGYIVRPCNVDVGKIVEKGAKLEGFVLGFGGEEASYLIEQIPYLKQKARIATFSHITSKSWYFADVKYKKTENGFIWKINNIQWQKKRKFK